MGYDPDQPTAAFPVTGGDPPLGSISVKIVASDINVPVEIVIPLPVPINIVAADAVVNTTIVFVDTPVDSIGVPTAVIGDSLPIVDHDLLTVLQGHVFEHTEIFQDVPDLGTSLLTIDPVINSNTFLNYEAAALGTALLTLTENVNIQTPGATVIPFNRNRRVNSPFGGIIQVNPIITGGTIIEIGLIAAGTKNTSVVAGTGGTGWVLDPQFIYSLEITNESGQTQNQFLLLALTENLDVPLADNIRITTTGDVRVTNSGDTLSSL